MNRKRITVGAIILLSISAFWFLGIDLSWFVADCPTCGYGKDILEYRILTMPIATRITYEHNTLLQKVAVDLNVPCKHSSLTRWHKHRYWGLLFCARPCINGTTWIEDANPWYDEAAAARLKDMVKNDPYLRDQFINRVLKNRDWTFWHAFLDRIKTTNEEKVSPSEKN